jgi:uncharacterized protein YbbC (DUF1343 family)
MTSGKGTTVRTGVQRLAERPELLEGGRIGLVTNYTGVLPDLTSNVTALRAAGVPLAALFGPEHGLRGSVQDGESEPDTVDGESGLPLYDTYRRTGAELDELVAGAKVDVLALDLADIGTRFYTYVWTMHDLIGSCRRLGLPFVVLDRPNPVTGLVAEGPLLDPAYASFVGRAAIPVRHGLTAGELARHLDPAVGVITVDGWRRADWFERTGQPWVMPSVNMPTVDSALVYPGTGLFEGTTLSEGRGTTRPFELIGAPYVDGRWAAELNALGLPGVRFRDVWFSPTFNKHAGERLRGVQPHVLDRNAFRPVHTAVSMLHLLRQLYPDGFGWRQPAGDRYHVDLLWGSDTLRRCLDAGDDPRPLVGDPAPPASWAGESALLYA